MQQHERKEAKNLEARRQREATRVQRLVHNPFGRQIGLDLEALDRQIKEKEEVRKLAQNQAEEEAEQQQKLAIMLEQRDLEAKLDQANTKAEIQSSWAQQIAAKQEQRLRAKKRNDQQNIRSGTSFLGEDPLRGERKRMQAIQMQRWCMQQQAAKQQVNEKKRKENERYANSCTALHAIATRSEQQAQEEKKRMALQVQQENQSIARMRREQSSRERKRALQGAGASVTENNFMMGSGTSKGIPTRQHFKGISEEQRRQIEKDNIMIMQQAQLLKEKKAQEKREEMQMLRAQNIYAQKAQIEADEESKAIRQQNLATLQQQQIEFEQRRKAEQRRNRQSGIKQEEGFYSGFGNSAR